MNVYQITGEELHIYNGELRKRLGRCCCKYCGNELILKNIIDEVEKEGRVEIFCSSCNRIEYGIEKELYEIAKYYVDEMKFDYYADLDANAMKYQMNVAKVCEIIIWSFNNVGYLTADGPRYPFQMKDLVLGEDVVIDDFILGELKEGDF